MTRTTRRSPRRSRARSPLRCRSLALLGAALVASGCTLTKPEDAGEIWDPYERSNREFHEFNKGWDTILIRPAAYAYDQLVAPPAQDMVTNVLNLIKLPADFVNYALQGEGELAAEVFARFLINVVFGGVVLDPATEFGFPYKPTDLGITFARWGAEEGPYIELPLLGPATARDGAGRVIESVLDPWSVDPFNLVPWGINDQEVMFTLLALNVIDFRRMNMDALDLVLYETEDSYVSTRAAYLQARRREVAGEATEESLPDVFAE